MIDVVRGQFHANSPAETLYERCFCCGPVDERGDRRYHYGLDEEGDMGALWDEWWEQSLTVSEGELKHALRDEVDLYGNEYRHRPDAPSVTVEIEWTDID